MFAVFPFEGLPAADPRADAMYSGGVPPYLVYLKVRYLYQAGLKEEEQEMDRTTIKTFHTQEVRRSHKIPARPETGAFMTPGAAGTGAVAGQTR